jgi:hypothetical protein
MGCGGAALYGLMGPDPWSVVLSVTRLYLSASFCSAQVSYVLVYAVVLSAEFYLILFYLISSCFIVLYDMCFFCLLCCLL